MNLLVINYSYFVFENYVFFIIYTTQNLSNYMTNNTNGLDYNKYIIDKILFNISKVIRVKELLYEHRKYYNLFIYILSFYYVLFSIFFIMMIKKTSRKTTYTLKLHCLNFLIKTNINVLNNINIDFFTRMLCFGQTNNTFIPQIKCNQSNNYLPLIFSAFTTIYSSFLTLFIQLYYEENFFISNSKFNTITSKIYIYQHLISIITSIELSLITKLTKEFFYISNFIMSIFLFIYYIRRLIYYNFYTNIIFGSTYFLNIYTSMFFFTVHFVECANKGLIYVLSSIFVITLFSSILNNLINKIVRKTPYYKISNNYFLLFYIKYIVDLITISVEDQEAKSLLRAIIEMHAIECPNSSCLTKNKQKIYLPASNKWSNRKLNPVSDQIFLKNFIPIILKYFITISQFNPELLMNLSYYYLVVIENFCLSLYYYIRVKKMKLNLEEKFLLVRLKILISEKLFEDFKEGNENCIEFVKMNPTLFFKYQYISEQFIDEIENDIDLNIEFWDFFFTKKNSDQLKFKKIFHIIDKIQTTKSKILISWNKLFNIYSGINPVFDLYLDYISEINDDSILKNQLQSYKKKKEIVNENYIKNYYNLLFHQETGLIIANGNCGKEGIIEYANYKIEKILDLEVGKIIGKNINSFMPKIFINEHTKFMRNFFEIGEKKIIDKGQIKTYALDNNKNLIQIHIGLKIFPMINNNISFISLINLDKVDDIIILDSFFIIHGMSKKLTEYFKIDNPNLFSHNDIPFYMICKNFISFYKTFFKKQNELYSENAKINDNYNENQFLLNEETNENNNELEHTKNSFLGNIEINENMEIEYQIKFPEFLSLYSFHSKDIENNQYIDSSTTISNILLQNEKSGELAAKFEEENELESMIENDTNIYNMDTKKISPKSTNDNYLSPKDTPGKENNCYSPRYKKKIINYQVNGVKYIFLYKSLFTQGKFEQLETLFDENTLCNFISLKFNFSFDRLHFGEKNHYYIIKCSNNKKIANDYSNSSYDNEIPTNNDFILKNKIKGLTELCIINNMEKNIFLLNVKDFQNIVSSNNDIRNLLDENIKDIKDNSLIYGEHNLKSIEENSQIHGESSSQNLNSAFVNHLSKLNRIIENRNKILTNYDSLYLIKYLKLLPFILFIEIIIFYIIYCIFYKNTKEELSFLRNYNNIVYSVQITLTIMLNKVVDYSVLFYSNLFEYNLDLRYGYNDKETYITISKLNMSKWYTETNKNIIFLQRYINKYIKDTNGRIWNKIEITYKNYVPWNESDYFPILAMNSLFQAYFIFTLNDLFNTSIVSENSDIFTIVDYSSYMSINGIINIILPKLISNMTFLIEDYMVFTNHQFDKFKILIIIFLIGSISIFCIMLIIKFFIINQFNYGMTKITKISQENIENLIENINKFKTNLIRKTYKYHLKKLNIFKQYENKNLIDSQPTKNISNKKILKKKTENKKSTSIINNLYYLQTKNIIKMKFSHFTIFTYVINILLIILSLIFLYYCPLDLIHNCSDLIKSHCLILQRFLFTTTSIFKMKAIFANYIDIFNLDITKIINNTLEPYLYNTLPKFNDLYDFYYNCFLLDACATIYDMNSIDYKKCIEQKFPQLINNTSSLRQYLLQKINELTYIYEFNLLNDLNFNPYIMFTMEEYSQILYSYSNYYIPVQTKYDTIFSKAFEKKANEIKLNVDYLFYFLFVWSIYIIIYQFAYYIPFFGKMSKISINFIQIIPSSIILDTPELEKWLEQAEN